MVQATKDPDIPRVGFAIPVNNEAERRILENGRAAGKDARQIQEDIDNHRASQTPSGQGGSGVSKKPVVTREVIMKDLNATVQPYLVEIRKLDPNAMIGYRGSLATGVKGDHKGGGPFDPSDFDVDIFIVSRDLAKSSAGRNNFRTASKTSQVGNAEKAIEEALRKNPNFSGLRDEDFTFRIFTPEEIWAKKKRGESFQYIMKSNAE